MEEELEVVGPDSIIVNFTCPKCGHDWDDDLESFDEDGFLEFTCGICKIKFVVDSEEK